MGSVLGKQLRFKARIVGILAKTYQVKIVKRLVLDRPYFGLFRILCSRMLDNASCKD